MGFEIIPILFFGPFIYIYSIKQQIKYSQNESKGALILPIISLIKPVNNLLTFFINPNFLLLDEMVLILLFFSLPYFGIYFFCKIKNKKLEKAHQQWQNDEKIRISILERNIQQKIEKNKHEPQLIKKEELTEILQTTEKIEQTEQELLKNLELQMLENNEKINLEKIEKEQIELENKIRQEKIKKQQIEQMEQELLENIEKQMLKNTKIE